MRLWGTFVLGALLSFATLSRSGFAVEVAITIDDLPIHEAKTKRISRLEVAQTMIEAFRKHGLPPVYGFVNGITAEKNSVGGQILQAWVAAGHKLGNHTFSHLNLNSVALKRYLEDIEKNEAILKEYAHGEEYRIFRYPYLIEGGTRIKRSGVREYLAEKGYQIAQVTIDFNDFLWNAPLARCLKQKNWNEIKKLKKSYIKAATEQFRLAQTVSQKVFGRQIRHILLIHIGTLNALAMDDLIAALKLEGATFIDLPTAMDDEVYSIDPDLVFSGGVNFLDQIVLKRRLKLPLHWRIPTQQLEETCK
ncbi:MAG: polysaccharide deacetylase family protein [Bdellovibrionota bacterium]